MWVWVNLGVGDGQGGLACCGPWGHQELDTTEQLSWTELSHSALGNLSFSARNRTPTPSPAVEVRAQSSELPGKSFLRAFMQWLWTATDSPAPKRRKPWTRDGHVLWSEPSVLRRGPLQRLPSLGLKRTFLWPHARRGWRLSEGSGNRLSKVKNHCKNSFYLRLEVGKRYPRLAHGGVDLVFLNFFFFLNQKTELPEMWTLDRSQTSAPPNTVLWSPATPTGLHIMQGSRIAHGLLEPQILHNLRLCRRGLPSHAWGHGVKGSGTKTHATCR